MKATNAQVQARVEEVLAIRLDGAEFWDVREYAREKEQEEGSAWHVAEGDKPLSDGQLWRYIGRADKMIAESCRASRKKLLRRHLAQRRNLYAKAVSQGDMRTALAAADSEAKLLGLFAPIRVRHGGDKKSGPIVIRDETDLDHATVEELRLLRDLRLRLEERRNGQPNDNHENATAEPSGPGAPHS
jgi:hypothetical protein